MRVCSIIGSDRIMPELKISSPGLHVARLPLPKWGRVLFMLGYFLL